MKTILHEGVEHRFPDDMADSEIQAVMSKEYPRAEETFLEKAGAVIKQAPKDVRATAANVATGIGASLAGANDLFNILWRSAGKASGLPEKFMPTEDATKLSQRFAVLRDKLAGRSQEGDPSVQVSQALSMPSGPGIGIIKAGLIPATQVMSEGKNEIDRLKNAAAAFGGGAGGQAVSKLMFPPSAVKMTDDSRYISDLADKQGIDLTLAQRTGSKFYERLEGRARISPYSSSVYADDATRQTQFNRAALAHTGSQADSARPEVLKNIKDNLESQYRHFAGSREVNAAANLFEAGEEIMRNIAPSADFKDVSKILKVSQGALKTAERGAMKAADLQKMRSSLNKDAYSAWKRGDTVEAEAFERVVDAIDDALESSLPTQAAREAFRNLRGQYASYKTIVRNMGRGGKEAATGDVSPSNMFGTITSRDPEAVLLNKSPMADLARVGQKMSVETPINQGSDITRLIDPRSFLAAKTYGTMQSEPFKRWAISGPFPGGMPDQQSIASIERILRAAGVGAFGPYEQP